MCTIPDTSYLDSISKISSIIIASFSLFFTYYIFKSQEIKTDETTKTNRKIDRLNTIILQHNLISLFSFFDTIILEVGILSNKKLSDEEKQALNEKLQDELKNLRLKFTDLLLAVDKTLYETVKKQLDDLLDKLTEIMFDEGINLEYKPKFDDSIIKQISSSKTGIVRTLYEYDL